MRPLAHTIPLDEARRLLAEAARGIDRVETVALAALGGRVMAEDVVAAGDVPPFTRAMMDGYAVRAEDTAGASREQPRTLAIVGTVFTGEVLSRAIGAGECAEVATGAPLPVGATAVVMVEDTAPVDDAHVQVRAAVRGDQHVGRAGTDIARGSIVLRAGDVLLPARVGAIAASGRAAVAVWAQPRVAIVSTGNEVVAPGQPLGPGQIHDVNRHTLSAIVEAHGGVAVPLDVASDTLDALGAAVDRAVACDLVVFSGGSSVGNRDLVMDILRGRGRVVFHGIATRPGKAHGVWHNRRRARVRHAGQSDVVSHERLRAARAVPPHAGAPAGTRAACRDGAAHPSRRLERGPASVLHGAAGERPGRAGLQGVRRHHEHGARRRLHRDRR